jgi:hypothetical protein
VAEAASYSGESRQNGVAGASDGPVCATPYIRLLRPADIEATALRALFRGIADEQGWQSGDDLSFPSRYDPFTVYFGLYVGDSLVGGLHVVRGNSSDLLPTRSVWPEIGFAGRTGVADVFLLALTPAVRARQPAANYPLFWSLGIALWQWCQREGIHELCGIATPRSAALYRRLGWPLSIIGPERNHWGEPCVPFLLSVSAVHAEIARRQAQGSQRYHDILTAAHRTETGEA